MSSRAGWGAWIRDGHLPCLLGIYCSVPEKRAANPSTGDGGGHKFLAAFGCSSASHEFICVEHRRSKHFNLAMNIKIISGNSRSDSPIVSTHCHFRKLLHIAPLGCRQMGLPAPHTPCVRSPLTDRRGALARFYQRRCCSRPGRSRVLPTPPGFAGVLSQPALFLSLYYFWMNGHKVCLWLSPMSARVRSFKAGSGGERRTENPQHFADAPFPTRRG